MKLFGRFGRKRDEASESGATLQIDSGGHLGKAGRLALAERNIHTTPVEPFEAVKRIGEVVRIITAKHPRSPALSAYAIALSAQARIVKHLNENPKVTSPVYFDDISELPSLTCMQADLVSYCQRFEPEPLEKAVLDSFSGWTTAGVQNLEGCRCPGDPISIELEIMLEHTHQVVDGKLIIEQSLGIRCNNKEKEHSKAHLENHYSEFTAKSGREDVLVVALSKALIESVTGEYGSKGHRFTEEATQHANEIDIEEWQSQLANILSSLVPAEQPEEVRQDETITV